MLFNIDKISDKFDSMTDFIPLFKFDSENYKDVSHTMYINKNIINAFSHFKHNNKDCLLLKVDYTKLGGYSFPREYIVCKEDNPLAFNALFKGLPEILPKHNNTTT